MTRHRTHRQLVYQVLRDAAATDDPWVSGNTFVEAGAGWRFGGRIHELRAAGHVIERRASKVSAVHEYRLVVEPQQMTLEGVA